MTPGRWKWPIYACAQVAGCFCGAAVIYGNYKSAIDQFEGGTGIRTVPGYSLTATAGVFCTYPQPFLTKTGQVFSEVVTSTMLMFCIFALKDDSNLGAGNLTPIALFFLIFALGATLGWETGYAINLARDFGPRLFTYFAGYGTEVWTAGNYYFWVSRCWHMPFRGRGVTPSDHLAGAYDRAVHWLHLWRFLIRCPHLYWRKSNQHAMDGSQETRETQHEGGSSGADSTFTAC